jgi:hypothetical protein
MYCNSFNIYINSEDLSEEALAKVDEFFKNDEKISPMLMYACSSFSEDDGQLYIQEASWYNFKDDLLRVSREFPYLKIEVIREGEDRDDNEKCWFFNGTGDCSMGELIYENKQPW